MARQSLYELLGLTDKASPADIRQAFNSACEALAAAPDDDEKRNRMTFLLHARDTLLDQRARALHDRDIWSEKRSQTSEPVPAVLNPRRGWLLAGALGLSLAMFAGFTLKKPLPPPDIVGAKSALIKPATPAELPKLTDIAALIPEREMESHTEPAPTPMPALVAASPGVDTEPLPVTFMVPNTPIFDKIITSTYAVVGTQTMGTGVVIDKDRLLTNCHVVAPNVLKGKIYAISAKTRQRFEITEAAFLVKDDACIALAPGLGGQPIVIGETRTLRAGARIFNLGFADGTLTLSDGLYLGSIIRSQQSYLISTNYCVPGVSGGALIDDEGRLLGLTSGSTPDHRYCASLTAETARSVLTQAMMPIDAFPSNYLTNFKRRW